MKILFLTSRLPYPPHRGDKLKIYNLIRELSQRNQITLLSFLASKKELEYLPALRELCVEVRTIHLPQWRSLFNCFMNLVSRNPFQVAYYRSGAMGHVAEKMIGQGGFDIIHVHLIRMAQYAITPKTDSSCLLDLTDAGSLYLQRFLNTERNPIKRILLRAELRRLARYERILEYFDKCLVCSDVDRMWLYRNAPAATIELLFNGIDLRYFNADGAIMPEPYRIIYTGNMSYYPNVDGARYFVTEIFPKIKESVPEAKLFVVGQDPPRSIRRIARDDIIVTGFVPEIRDYYLRSTVAIAPIRFGAGTLNKVLEPMALGVPVVTTAIGVEGLSVQHGRDVLIANEPNEFANAVVQVLQNEKLRMRLIQNARSLVRGSWGWHSIVRRLEEYYAELKPSEGVR